MNISRMSMPRTLWDGLITYLQNKQLAIPTTVLRHWFNLQKIDSVKKLPVDLNALTSNFTLKDVLCDKPSQERG